MPDEAEREREVNSALDQVASPNATDLSTFTAANGLVLRMRRVPQAIIADATRKIPVPRPPKVFVEEKGREEENPADPAYEADHRNYMFDIGMLAVSVYFIMGTSILNIPEDMEPPEAESWEDMVRAVVPDSDIPKEGPRRYLAWLKYYALPDDEQTRLLQQAIRYSGGTLEADVTAAQRTFRSNEARDTVSRIRPATEGERGNSNGQRPTGYDPRAGGSGSRDLRRLDAPRVDESPAF